MKSVLISIQPKWCELIASGKKTVEVRKTRPKMDTPFKCYIYETQGKRVRLSSFFWGYEGTSKVIGEFVCDKIGTYYPIYGEVNPYSAILESYGCLTAEEIRKYISTHKRRSYGFNKIYGWHISGLVIYDKPRELGEFYTVKQCNACKGGYESTACIYDENCKVPVPLKSPPQSWGYVESEGRK